MTIPEGNFPELKFTRKSRFYKEYTKPPVCLILFIGHIGDFVRGIQEACKPTSSLLPIK